MSGYTKECCKADGFATPMEAFMSGSREKLCLAK